MRIQRATCRCLVAGLIALALSAAASQARSTEIDGFTEPYRDIDVAASEMGRIVSLQVHEGERVRAGGVLARLDEDVLMATLEIARAGMESEGRLEAAETELRMYRESLEKLEDLQTRKHATQREVERAQLQTEMAAARVKATREEMVVKALEFARTKTQLEQRCVVSPIDGIVTRVYKDEGEFVSPSDPVVVKVVQLDPLVIVFSVPVADARQLVAGETVKVRIDTAPQPIDGVVEFISPMADAQSGTMRTRVRIPNPEETIPSGMTCHLLLPGHLKLPGDAPRSAPAAPRP